VNFEISRASDLALRKQVERAVRPVLASEQRKLRMREELLAHLTAIFDEEQQRLGDETAALAKSRGRFGDPAQLTVELNRTVSAWQRLAAAVEHWERQVDKSFAKETEQPLSRFAMRSLLTLSVLMIGVAIVVLGPAWLIGGLPDSGVLFLLPRFLPLMLVAQWSILVATAHVASSTANGSPRWALLFLHSVVWSTILTVLGACFWWSISQRGLNPGEVAIMGVRTWVFIAVALVSITLVVDYSRALRRQREAWTLLDIDD
jgi:hypothetical protein